jgi:DNA-binding MarR family transcriptional regulator
MDKHTGGDHALASALQMASLIQELARTLHSHWAASGRAVHLGANDVFALTRLVEAGEMTVVDLQRALGVPSSTVSELAVRLERAGMISRSRRRPDRRLVTLTATARGRRFADRVLAPLRSSLSELLGAARPAQAAFAARLLHDAAEALSAAHR